MSTSSEISVLLKVKHNPVQEAQMALEQMVQRHGLPMSVYEELLVVCDEVLSNIVKYGASQSREPVIAMDAAIVGQSLKLVFKDDGVPFNPLTKEAPDLELPVYERNIGGLGVFLVQSLTNEQHYSRTKGQNVLTLLKTIT